MTQTHQPSLDEIRGNMNDNQLTHTFATLAFYAKNPGLHSFQRGDKRTAKAINTLAAHGFLHVHNDTCQAEFTGKVFVYPS